MTMGASLRQRASDGNDGADRHAPTPPPHPAMRSAYSPDGWRTTRLSTAASTTRSLRSSCTTTFVDREDDLEAGRWNALVAAVSPLPQTLEYRDRNRAALGVALMTSGAATELGRRIDEGFDDAARVSVPLGRPPLTTYLHESGARARRQALEVDAHYRGVADEATRLLFGRSRCPARTGRGVEPARRHRAVRAPDKEVD